ncbi:trypsin-like [Cydia pomonella]|uniref:trypsin-like n=1 Tax=Cydia pomonella TaxID=82600 RepID=UPI002ADD3E53|nr:trypsin-like [Cydia pomonella]
MYLFLFLNTLIAISALDESRVYSGNDISPTDQGYLVVLFIATGKDDPVRKCSGSMISSNWIITAAHCLPAEKPIKLILVRQQNKKVQRTLGRVKPINDHKHPTYIQGNNSIANSGYDIALLKTSKPLVFDDYAKAIDPARVSPRNNQWAIIAGYGQNELGKSFPRQSAVKVSKCFFDNSGRLLCSNSKVKSGHGDSGRALTLNGKLIGVVSGVAKYNCEETNPNLSCITIYANVAAHYMWIKNVTGFKK